jgi:hypothetical protein
MAGGGFAREVTSLIANEMPGGNVDGEGAGVGLGGDVVIGDFDADRENTSGGGGATVAALQQANHGGIYLPQSIAF